MNQRLPEDLAYYNVTLTPLLFYANLDRDTINPDRRKKGRQAAKDGVR
ncbi:MAG TPA: hypothetical protein VH186_28910 [Chloroflexia bacterium]|nr:hypothetical protein [Chloroflexia bacterium]